MYYQGLSVPENKALIVLELNAVGNAMPTRHSTFGERDTVLGIFSKLG